MLVKLAMQSDAQRQKCGTRILERIGATSRTEAATIAVNLGLITG